MDGWIVLEFSLEVHGSCDEAAAALASMLGRGVLQKEGPEGCVITAYVPAAERDTLDIPALEEVVASLVPGEVKNVRVSGIEDRDWNLEWKRHYAPVRVGRSVVVVPSWEEFSVGKGDVVVRIDPGQAFGTGTHATTVMMMEMMENAWNMRPGWRPSVLDVGTGTGILAILAAKLGVSRAEAIDVDGFAVQAAQANLAMNGVETDVAVSNTPIERVDGRFQVVLANLDFPTIMSVWRPLVERVGAGGLLLLSGLLNDQAGAVVRLLEREAGLVLVHRREREEWVALEMVADER